MIDDYAGIVAAVRYARHIGIEVSPQQRELFDDAGSILRNLIPDSKERDGLVFANLVKLYKKDKQSSNPRAP